MISHSVSSGIEDAVYINTNPSALSINPRFTDIMNEHIDQNIYNSEDFHNNDLDNIEDPEINLIDRIAPVIQSYMESNDKLEDIQGSEYDYSLRNIQPDKPVYQVSRLYEIYSRGLLATKKYGKLFEKRYTEAQILSNKF